MDDLIREMLEPDRPAPGVVARRRRLTAATAIIGLAAVGVTSLTTNALFTSDDSSSQSGFTTGTVVIDAPGTSWAVTTPSPANAAPGDDFFIGVPVANEGTLELRYAVELAATADTPSSSLLDFLSYELYVPAPAATAVTCTAAGTAALTPLTSGALNVSDPIKAVGDKATGPDTGDRVLGVGGDETLCLKVLFDIDADDTVQGHDASFNLEFFSEQTANNS